MKKTPEAAVFVIGEGAVTALAGGPLSMADMGPRHTRRVSTIEFDDAAQRWAVTVLPTAVHPTNFVMHFRDYDAALAWERDLFNNVLATSPEVILG